MRIYTVIGARPQFIKASVVSRAIRKESAIEEKIIYTGQHYDANMADIFFRQLAIPAPDFSLGIGGGSHGENTGRMIESIEKVLLSGKPDMVLVYGDTDSTLAGALAAVKCQIPVAHVESGLRSYKRSMPEEVNRVLTDQVSSLLFSPCESARKNLLKEGINDTNIHIVGDVMLDVALDYARQAEEESTILADLVLTKGAYLLLTVHRADNAQLPENLVSILQGMGKSALPVIFPVHPRTRITLSQHNIALPSNVKMIDPVGYLDMAMLEKNASMIATDSGGMQKEAYFYGVPCITLRDETEWTELVDCGANILTGASAEKIEAALSKTFTPDVFTQAHYGDGRASGKITRILLGEKAA